VRRDDEAVLTYIQDYKEAHDGNSPSLSEISAHFNRLSKTWAFSRVSRLMDSGHLYRKDGKLCLARR
jgi:hypothetical protein